MVRCLRRQDLHHEPSYDLRMPLAEGLRQRVARTKKTFAMIRRERHKARASIVKRRHHIGSRFARVHENVGQWLDAFGVHFLNGLEMGQDALQLLPQRCLLLFGEAEAGQACQALQQFGVDHGRGKSGRGKPGMLANTSYDDPEWPQVEVR